MDFFFFLNLIHYLPVTTNGIKCETDMFNLLLRRTHWRTILKRLRHFRLSTFEIRLKSKFLIKNRQARQKQRRVIRLFLDAWFYFSVSHWRSNSSVRNVVTYVTVVNDTFHKVLVLALKRGNLMRDSQEGIS